jgi:hypothetical protein
MARHVEPLNGGVWSALDPAFLRPGQLSAGRNFVYLGGSPAIYRSWGRAVFGAVSASAVDVNGLRDAQFDGGDHILIAAASASYLTAAVGDTGTFGVLASGLPGVPAQLEAVQYRNRFYLLNGIPGAVSSALGTNKVLYVSATGTGIPASTRQHGMSPVISPPTVSTTAGTFSQAATGNYEYWTTEVANIQTDGARLAVESTFMPPPTTISVNTLNVVPVISRPAISNPLSTHWRIYRSPPKVLFSDISFPVGYMIAELPTATMSAWDAIIATNTGWIYPTSANDGSGYFIDWASASSAFTDNAVFASASSNGKEWVGGMWSGSTHGFYGFVFPGVAGSIKGVEVSLQGYVSNGTGPADLAIYIGPNRGTNNTGGFSVVQIQDHGASWRIASKSASISATTSAAPQTVTVGASADSWFPFDYQYPLAANDFDTNFMVAIENVNSTTKSVGVDYVAARVYYNSTNDSTIQFPSVVYTYGDEVAQVGKNGTPPSSSCGDIFQDSLVVNDLSDSSLIRYSYPGSPESFPATYYLNFETRENDAVKMIRVVNNRLIVGLGTSLWRVNYLPSERDATFDRGKATECITRDYGVVNPMCCCTFSPDGASEQLAFVSNQGIHYTDGYNFTTLTDGTDWRTDCLATSSTSSAIALINDKENQILRFYYRNDALGTESYMCLPLCYGAGHWANGQAKVGGLLHMRNAVASGATAVYSPLKSAWSLDRSDGSVDFLFGYGVQTNSTATGIGYATGAGAGKVYRETGTTIPSDVSTMQFTTRRMYLAGMSREWKLGEVYGYTGSYSGGPVVTYTAKNSKTNGAAESTVGTKSITLSAQNLHRVTFNQMCEGLRIAGSVVAGTYRQENLILDGENFGLEDGGR